MTNDDIVIRYSGLPFYGYEGYRMVSALIYISRNWESNFSALVTCEHMQDESIHGYTYYDHVARSICAQKRDVIDYMKRVGREEN